MIFSLAARNLSRRKKRTLVTSMSIAFGLCLALMAIGTRQYVYSKLMDLSAQMAYGNLTIAAKGLFDGDTHSRVNDFSSLIEEVSKNINSLESIKSRQIGEAHVVTAYGSSSAAVFSYDPSNENTDHNLIISSISKGRAISSSGEKEANVGYLLAKKLKLDIGSELIYSMANANGEIVSLSVKVVGFIKTGNRLTDKSLFTIPISVLQKELGYRGSDTQFLSLFVEDQDSIEDVIVELSEKINLDDRLKVFHWSETQPELASIVKGDRVMYRLMLLFIGIVIGSGIFTCMVMNVVERRKEIGTMLALGISPTKLAAMLSLEALSISTLGCFIGTLIFIPLYFYVQNNGIDLSSLMGSNISAGGVFVGKFILYCKLNFKNYVFTVISLYIMTLLSVVGPCLRAINIEPIESISEK